MNKVYFKQLIRSVMVDNKFDRRVRNKNTGKLDLTRLPKAMTGSTKVFTKKEERKGKQYNVVILVDCSGSMTSGLYADTQERVDLFNQNVSWGRFYRLITESPKYIASDCAVILDECFNDISLDTAVIGFSSQTKVIKKFGQKKAPDRVRSELMKFGGGGTNTAEALTQAYKMLRDKEGENLVVVLTDGQPNSRKAVDEAIKKAGDVITLGVGIGIDVRDMVGGIAVNKTEDLFSSFIKLMSKQFKRG